MSLNVLLRFLDTICCMTTIMAILLKRYISDLLSRKYYWPTLFYVEKSVTVKSLLFQRATASLPLLLPPVSFSRSQLSGYTWSGHYVTFERSRSYRSRVDQELEGPSSPLHQPRLLLLPLLSSYPYHGDHVVVLSELRSESFMSRFSRQNNRSRSSDHVATFVDLCPGHRSKVDLFSGVHSHLTIIFKILTRSLQDFLR